jgi:hypothetical protein
MHRSDQQHGSINVKVVGQTSASVYGITTGTLADTSSITNSGTISVEAVNQVASYAGAWGISVGDMSGTSSITNTGDIIVKTVNEATRSNDSAYATGIWVGSMAAGTSITNSGLISTDLQRAGDDTERAFSVRVNGGAGGALSNSGTLIGGVYLNGSWHDPDQLGFDHHLAPQRHLRWWQLHQPGWRRADSGNVRHRLLCADSCERHAGSY